MVFKPKITYRTTVKAERNQVLQRKLKTWQSGLLDLLRQMPPKRKRTDKLRWTSERQRRAFFATRGFGRGIPTKRSGKVADWKLFVNYKAIEDHQGFFTSLLQFMVGFIPKGKSSAPDLPPDGLLVELTNPAPYQRYVTGVDQQGFHADTGWVQTAPIITSGIQQLEDIISGTDLV